MKSRNESIKGKMVAKIQMEYSSRNATGWTGERHADPTRRVIRSSISVIRAIERTK
jgi:hypothetical protein